MQTAKPSSLPKLVVFGEALTDFIIQSDGRYEAREGGACWNVARVAARLGCTTGYAGAVSQDPFGARLYEATLQAGCDMRFIQQYDKSPLLAMVTSIHPPQYFFIGDDSADLAFKPEQLPEGWLNSAEWVHFGCISLARAPLAHTLLNVALRVAEAGVKISFDPNWRVIMSNNAAYAAIFEKMTQIASLIKVSDEDLCQLFSGCTANEGLERLRQLAPHADILYTQGEKGMQLITPHCTYQQPAPRIKVADTVGAGDAAIGGLLASYLLFEQTVTEKHLQFAAATAALVCQHTGAYAPTLAEIHQLNLRCDVAY